MAHGYAQQKFFEALRPLVSGNEPLRRRLTAAADALVGLQSDDLPEGMRDDFQQLRHDLILMQPPLRWPIGYLRPRDVTSREAPELAIKVLEMYTKLLGGLT